jgi:ABC-type antimicrobial peptide transport system permease subunit
MSPWTLVSRSLRYFAQSHFAVGAGVAAATAVIVGALVVGDSVRGSLRGLVVDRLGNLQGVLQSRTYFRPHLIDRIKPTEQAKILPAIILPSATVEARHEEELLRASQVQVLGIESSFWQQASTPPMIVSELLEDVVAINAGLANELNLNVGDEITVRFAKNSGVPADNPLGRKDDASINMPRQKVAAILPDDSVGGIGLKAGQSVPKNVFVGLASLQAALETNGAINAAWVAASPHVYSGTQLCNGLNEQLIPSIEDFGLQLDHHRRVFPDAAIDVPADTTAAEVVVYDYYQLSSTDLILDDETTKAVESSLGPSSQRVMAYLANAIYRVDASGAAEKPTEVPYSIVAGIESGGGINLDELSTISLEGIAERPCWINSWLANQLNVKPGELIQLNYYEPETVDGREVEVNEQFIVAGIVPIEEPENPYRRDEPAKYSRLPTIFNDPNITPEVPGVTDQDSINNWDLPFKTDRKVRKIDDKYWNNHRLTPKVFLRYEDASSRKLFGSRFGSTTSIRFESPQVKDVAERRAQIEQALLTTKQQKGLAFQPFREQQLKSASGTTPFDMLFLSLSFFVIVAALLLVSLLFRLGIQQRASQIGLLLAQGFSPQRVRGLLVREVGIVSLLGSVAGVFLGLLYARIMIAGLESWWLGAIAVAFLKFSFTPLSLAIGAICGALASLFTIFWTLRKMCLSQPLSLLRGNSNDTNTGVRRVSRWMLMIAGGCVVGAFALSVIALGLTGMERAGCFFGCGMLVLCGAMIGAREWLATRGALKPNPANAGLFWLAWLAVCRSPVRSVLSLGLLSVATFLIASMGVFQMSPTVQGYGGFDLMAESSQPIYRNIALPEVREEAIGNKAKAIAGSTIVSLRARLGEDASCNNLFQVAQPTVLGVPKQLQNVELASDAKTRFQWAGALNKELPWSTLEEAATGTEGDPIPVVLDQNTAQWSLHQGASIGAITKLNFDGSSVFFKTVGLLSNSVLQGRLLISEANFKLLFPKLSGFQFFLIRSGAMDQKVAMETLESGWSDDGLDVVSSAEVLSRLLSVQNTYISAFQSLGALGLLLGTFGLAAVQTRSVIERHRELSLMRAVGFSDSRIAKMLTLETALLLGGGILIGVLAAAIAIVPYIIEVGPQTSLLQPFVMLVLVLVAGFLSALLAIRTAMKLPILAGLRAE